MSLESKIEALTAAVIGLTARLDAQSAHSAANVAAQHIPPIVASAPQQPMQAPPSLPVAPPAAPAFAPPLPPPAAVAPPAAMPPPPSFVTPPAPAANGAVPFTDSKGLIGWVTQAYTAMGAAKGAQIQGIITQLGYKAINEIQPQHFAPFYQAVEALRVAP